VLRAIYGERGAEEKKAEYEKNLRSWWTAYAERKDDEDEFVADTLLYDKTHLPRTAPAPECVRRLETEQAASGQARGQALEGTRVSQEKQTPPPP
jgi:hypothetical protein